MINAILIRTVQERKTKQERERQELEKDNCREFEELIK